MEVQFLAAKTTNELAYTSATDLLRMIRNKEISCLDLLNFYIRRMVQYNPEVNAIVYTDLASARSRAKEADEALDRGELWGPLHGLPMTIKDAYEVAGMPATGGCIHFKDHFPVKNADLVEKLLDAGAIIYGKTNLPYLAADWQSYNKVYGITNNPWDVKKTPGGSSGGSAASLAAGFTSLEVGSDLNGSVRIPAHFCGVYGHRVTHGIVSVRGHIPGDPGDLSVPDLAAAGALARSAEDVELLLKVINGPGEKDAAGWSLNLSKPTKKDIKEYRVIAWIDDDFCRIDTEIRNKYLHLLDVLCEAGVTVEVRRPEGYNLEEFENMMITLTGCVVSSSLTRVQSVFTQLLILFMQPFSFKKSIKSNIRYLKGMLYSHRKWQLVNEARLKLQDKCNELFKSYDILLTPVTPWTAIDHNPNFVQAKKVMVNNEQRSYLQHITWNSIATILGLPSTSAPVGIHTNGLPVNIQVTSAPYNDLITLDFCKKLEAITGGFKKPANY